MARKQTSARVSAIAGSILHRASAFDNDAARSAALDALAACGLPLSTVAADALLERIGAVLQPFVDDARALAASCLSQDEEGPLSKAQAVDEMNAAEAFGGEACE